MILQQAPLRVETLAEASGISRQTLLNLSSGKYYGDLRTWLRLSRAFSVGLDALLADVWTPRLTGSVWPSVPEPTPGGTLRDLDAASRHPATRHDHARRLGHVPPGRTTYTHFQTAPRSP